MLALAALFGAAAHLLHYLMSEFYLGKFLQAPFQQATASPAIHPSNLASFELNHDFAFHSVGVLDNEIIREQPALSLWQVITGTILVVMGSLCIAVAILKSALHAHQDACKRLSIHWYPNGQLDVFLRTHVSNLPLATGRLQQCQLESGGYNSHWMVILRCSHQIASSDSEAFTQGDKRFCILLARDTLPDESFRHLRLWMRLVAPKQLNNKHSPDLATATRDKGDD